MTDSIIKIRKFIGIKDRLCFIGRLVNILIFQHSKKRICKASKNQKLNNLKKSFRQN